MSAGAWLAIGLLGGLGAAARALVAARIARGAPPVADGFPLGILVVNLTGAFALGLVTEATSGTTRHVLAAGLIGAYTTFSTWMLDTHLLWAEGRRGAATLNLLGSLVAGLVVVEASRRVGRVL